MKGDKRTVLVLVLVLVIVILLGFIGYLFLINPALNGLVVRGYNQGQVDTINAILLQISNSGYVQLPAGNNQTLILVPYQPQLQQ
ncbi:hypothetical protein A3K82_02745 [Candidatus Pacearchaeota archaeon RBG_19FT_COMBO_34_9]|nr:MAG: hypothetical protein A3K82_02745 [Candidatus Pacearchaeota archaeon RBG_19FT_COMBO_34_9]OGJ16975.1 MAG: hypothetical protein A3K74_01120 [Candidatus Pacearchaeota archaeon RBG_13_33_26]